MGIVEEARAYGLLSVHTSQDVGQVERNKHGLE